jgi:hypothetical protein
MRFGDFEPADAFDAGDVFNADLFDDTARDLLADVVDLLADVVRVAETVARLAAKPRRG